MNHKSLVCAVLATAIRAQVPAAQGGEPPQPWRTPTLDRVVHDEPGDGHLWACGQRWKASFGPEGFTFVPLLAGAPRNMPVHFRVARAAVGGREIALASDAPPHREGDRVTFARGALREVYDLSVAHIEQSFVIDTMLPGDVVVDLEVATELREDPSRAGLQFVCEFGAVDYGDAFVVRDGVKSEIATEWSDGTLRMRVPAALRGHGPVVIDPILSTQTVGTTGTYVRVDSAYDVTNDRHMVVFESVWTISDHDIWTMMFDGAGNPIAGSMLAVDFSTTNWVYPRAANLNAADRFLVAATVDDPVFGRQMIHGRTRDAFGVMAMNAPQLLSDPNLPGDNQAAEVGADPATGPGNHDWLVVWTNRTSPTSRIHGRLVLGTGLPRSTNVTPVQPGDDAVDDVQVSRSNGNGYVPHPRWCVVYTRRVGNEKHVVGRVIDPDGNVGNEVPFDTGSNVNSDPKVSSPIADGTKTRFLVVYLRSNTVRGLVAGFQPNWLGTNYYDLTAVAGLKAGALDTDSDGARFVVASPAPFAGQVDLSMLGWESSALMPLGFAQTLPSGFSGFADTQVAALRSSGGPVGQYGIGYLQGTGATRTAALLRYGGYTSGSTSDVLATACLGSSLVMTLTGQPYLGSTVEFTLSGFGTAFPLILLGGANASAVPVCAGCSLGLRADLPIHPFAGPSVSLVLPTAASLVGETFAMQGLALGTHPCLGGIELADTIRWTIR